MASQLPTFDPLSSEPFEYFRQKATLRWWCYNNL